MHDAEYLPETSPPSYVSESCTIRLVGIFASLAVDIIASSIQSSH